MNFVMLRLVHRGAISANLALRSSLVQSHTILRSSHVRTLAAAVQPAPLSSAFVSSLQDCISPLTDWGVIRVSGKDAHKLLHNLTTNDFEHPASTAEDRDPACMYTAFLNQKGRVLFDGLITAVPSSPTTATSADSAAKAETFLVQTKRALVPSLMGHLKKYVLRMKVEVNDISSELAVWSVMSRSRALLDDVVRNNRNPGLNMHASVDPRLSLLGARLLLPAGKTPVLPSSFEGSPEPVDHSVHHALRLILGVPDGELDVVAGKSLPLECNLDWLNGVSFTKGCYLGQELTARTHFQGLIRKRLMPAYLESMPSALSASILAKHKTAPAAAAAAAGAQHTADEALPQNGKSTQTSTQTQGAQTRQSQAQTPTARSRFLFPHRFFNPSFPATSLPPVQGPVFISDEKGVKEVKEAASVVSTRFNLAMVQMRLEHMADVYPRKSSGDEQQPEQKQSSQSPSSLLISDSLFHTVVDVGGQQRVLRVVPYVPAWWP